MSPEARPAGPEARPAEGGPSRARFLGGAAAGAAIGVGIWAALATFTGIWTGFGALLVGGLAGGGSRVLGGRGNGATFGAAAIALLASFAGQGFAAGRLHGESLRNRRAGLDREHYAAFDAAARSWEPGMQGEAVAKFAFAHEFVSFAGDRDARLREFARDVVPRLEAWKRSPPSFEAWRAEGEAAIRGGPGPWASYLSSPLDWVPPLDLLCWILGAAAAGRLAARPEPSAPARRRAPVRPPAR